MGNELKAVLSKKRLKLIPDLYVDSFSQIRSRENEVDLVVTNNSDRFASFQVDIQAIGLKSRPKLKWYKVEPELCAKKPPGDSTKFRIVITDPPLPSFETTLNLKVKVFSVEYEDLYAEERLKLDIDKPRRVLKIYLPIKSFKIFPGDLLKIPVLAYNLSPKSLDISIKIFGLEPSWLKQGNKLELQLPPGSSEEKFFFCEPPQDIQVLSQGYDFLIEAQQKDSGYSPPVQRGNLEIMPLGVVAFECPQETKTIPCRFGLIPQSKYNLATYDLEFENKSNISQKIKLELSETDIEKYNLECPESLEIDPTEIDCVELVSRKKRPWLGGERRFSYKISPILTNKQHFSDESNNRVSIYPNVKLLELRVRPIIPVLAQIVAGITGVILIWLFWLLNPPSHKGPVNSVRIIGNVGTVVSGSSDHTIRRWQINSDSWGLINRLFSRRLRYEGLIVENAQKAIRVIRPSPRDEDVIAAGLDNGEISFWNILSTKQIKMFPGNDRVFDLDFTNDSRNLFSVHGSGLIKQWNLRSQLDIPTKQVYPRFAISAIAISETKNEPRLVVAAGRYGKLVIWDWQAEKLYNLRYKLREHQNFQNFMGQNHYIESLAISNHNNLLAMADNKGYITLWNFSKIRKCINADDQSAKKNKNVGKNGKILFAKNIECNQAIIDQWQDGHQGSPVRSIALTKRGCYLASTGDDGRVMLWPLERQGQRNRQIKAGKVLSHFSKTKLNSVDIETLDNHIFIVSDAKKYRLSLHRVERMTINADCYQ